MMAYPPSESHVRPTTAKPEGQDEERMRQYRQRTADKSAGAAAAPALSTPCRYTDVRLKEPQEDRPAPRLTARAGARPRPPEGPPPAAKAARRAPRSPPGDPPSHQRDAGDRRSRSHREYTQVEWDEWYAQRSRATAPEVQPKQRTRRGEQYGYRPDGTWGVLAATFATQWRGAQGASDESELVGHWKKSDEIPFWLMAITLAYIFYERFKKKIHHLLFDILPETTGNAEDTASTSTPAPTIVINETSSAGAAEAEVPMPIDQAKEYNHTNDDAFETCRVPMMDRPFRKGQYHERSKSPEDTPGAASSCDFPHMHAPPPKLGVGPRPTVGMIYDRDEITVYDGKPYVRYSGSPILAWQQLCVHPNGKFPQPKAPPAVVIEYPYDLRDYASDDDVHGSKKVENKSQRPKGTVHLALPKEAPMPIGVTSYGEAPAVKAPLTAAQVKALAPARPLVEKAPPTGPPKSKKKENVDETYVYPWDDEYGPRPGMPVKTATYRKDRGCKPPPPHPRVPLSSSDSDAGSSWVKPPPPNRLTPNELNALNAAAPPPPAKNPGKTPSPPPKSSSAGAASSWDEVWPQMLLYLAQDSGPTTTPAEKDFTMVLAQAIAALGLPSGSPARAPTENAAHGRAYLSMLHREALRDLRHLQATGKACTQCISDKVEVRVGEQPVDRHPCTTYPCESFTDSKLCFYFPTERAGVVHMSLQCPIRTGASAVFSIRIPFGFKNKVKWCKKCGLHPFSLKEPTEMRF